MKVFRLFRKRAAAKNNSFKTNTFCANKLSPDSQSLFFVPEKLRKSSRTKIDRTRLHSLIYQKSLNLGISETLVAMYNEAAASL